MAVWTLDLNMASGNSRDHDHAMTFSGNMVHGHQCSRQLQEDHGPNHAPYPEAAWIVDISVVFRIVLMAVQTTGINMTLCSSTSH